jgi:hypothetical protein
MPPIFRIVPRIVPLDPKRLDRMAKAETRTVICETHRAQIGWVFRLIGLVATRSQYGCWRLHACDVSTLEHRPKTCLDHVRHAIRLTHDASRTEESSVSWMQRSSRFHHTRHPNDRAHADIDALLTPLAVAQQVGTSTHHRALRVFWCLYGNVRNTPLDFPIDAVSAKKPTRVLTDLTKEETLTVIEPLSGTPRFMARQLYDGGLRLMECLR